MIRILAVADTEDRALYDDYNSERWAKERVELIVSCGDLRPGYLDFLVSVFNVPCFYVRGNHDIAYGDTELGGCVSLHQRVERYKGVTFFGLEGCRWYNGGPAQYTERQMWWKVFRAGRRLGGQGSIDVIVTHGPPRICPLPEKRCLCVRPLPGTPPANVGQTCYVDPERRNWELADVPHRGFECFQKLALKLQPRFFLHGHTHLGYGARPREFQLGQTRVVDCYGHVLLDV